MEESESSERLSMRMVYWSTSPTLSPAGALSVKIDEDLVMTGTGKFGVVLPKSRKGREGPATEGSWPQAAVMSVPSRV